MAFPLNRVLKAMLFAASGPLTIRDIQAAFGRFHEQKAPAPPAGANGDDVLLDSDASGIVEPEEVSHAEIYDEVPTLLTAARLREALDTLAAELREADEVFQLVEGAQGYRLVSNPAFARWIRVLRDEPPPVRLSPSALETLAIVAYRQPVTRSEIEAIRGVSADAGINKLLERELVRVTGRADLPGRPLQYGTTERFFEFVGIKSLEELPASDVLSSRQIDGWLQRAESGRQLSDADMGLSQEELPLDADPDDVGAGDAGPGIPGPEVTGGSPSPTGKDRGT